MNVEIEQVTSVWLARGMKNTRKQYRYGLLQWLAYLNEIHVEPEHVTPTHVIGWRDSLQAAGKSKATIYTRLTFVSSWYTELVKARQIAENPCIGINPRSVTVNIKGSPDVTRLLDELDHGRPEFAVAAHLLTVTTLSLADVTRIRSRDVTADTSGCALIAVEASSVRIHPPLAARVIRLSRLNANDLLTGHITYVGFNRLLTQTCYDAQIPRVGIRDLRGHLLLDHTLQTCKTLPMTEATT